MNPIPADRRAVAATPGASGSSGAAPARHPDRRERPTFSNALAVVAPAAPAAPVASLNSMAAPAELLALRLPGIGLETRRAVVAHVAEDPVEAAVPLIGAADRVSPVGPARAAGDLEAQAAAPDEPDAPDEADEADEADDPDDPDDPEPEDGLHGRNGAVFCALLMVSGLGLRLNLTDEPAVSLLDGFVLISALASFLCSNPLDASQREAPD